MTSYGNVKIQRGDTEKFSGVVLDANGDPVNISSGYVLSYFLQKYDGDTSPLVTFTNTDPRLVIVDDGTASLRGQFTISLTSANTTQAQGLYVDSVKTTASGVVKTVMSRKIEIEDQAG